MNICFFTSEYPSPQCGGVERVTFNLFREFKARGYNVYIVARSEAQSGFRFESQDVYILPNSQKREFLESLFRKKNIHIAINQSHHDEIFGLLTDLKKDVNFSLVWVLHTDPLYALKGIRDDFDSLLMGCFIRKLLIFPYALVRMVVRWFARRCILCNRYKEKYAASDAVVLLSEKYKLAFSKLAGLRNASRLFSIGNPSRFATSIAESGPKEKMVLFVGRMCHTAKRPDRMIRIWHQVSRLFPDWTLYMVGDGPERNILEHQCCVDKIPNVVFTGNINPESYYERASILCMTSTYEGFGLVLVEALQHGCIPIAYNSYGALSDIIKDGWNGFSVTSFRATEYVSRLELLMSDVNMRLEMSQRARGSCGQFNVDSIADKWKQLFSLLYSSEH